MKVSRYLSDSIIEWALFTEAAERYANLFAPGAGGALHSCDTGAVDGIADSLATFLNMPVTAPEVPVGRGSITAERRGQGINLTLTYPNTVARTTTPDPVLRQLAQNAIKMRAKKRSRTSVASS